MGLARGHGAMGGGLGRRMRRRVWQQRHHEHRRSWQPAAAAAAASGSEAVATRRRGSGRESSVLHPGGRWPPSLLRTPSRPLDSHSKQGTSSSSIAGADDKVFNSGVLHTLGYQSEGSPLRSGSLQQRASHVFFNSRGQLHPTLPPGRPCSSRHHHWKNLQMEAISVHDEILGGCCTLSCI